ncbi:hypothetical protein [Rhizosphaericola mali]|uniref:Uncharacterized protein n=1 Tax=Rhizosphaericola mali TaxID=2545455 RepID=A0A5P2G2W9_9BACT|nr:hypothetical protein [Rhizosphaericola mali]QES89547.1 hypothetical protein E0W69_013030 [Rhizosphaericola mali]
MQDRDLLVITRDKIYTDEQLQDYVESLTRMLFYAESMDNFCIANEILDLNRYKLINRPFRIKQIISEPEKPFVFIVNKN